MMANPNILDYRAHLIIGQIWDKYFGCPAWTKEDEPIPGNHPWFNADARDIAEMMSLPDDGEDLPCPHGQTALTCEDCKSILNQCPG